MKSNCAQPSAPLSRANQRANRRALVADHLTFEGGAGVWVISEKDILLGWFRGGSDSEQGTKYGFYGDLDVLGHTYKIQFYYLASWTGCLFWTEAFKRMWRLVVSRVVKSSRLPAKIAAYLVSIGRLLCLAFLYRGRFLNALFVFKIKYPWTGCLLWQLNRVLQNFLTTLGEWSTFFLVNDKVRL